jgi:hypothetical protein
MLISRVAAPASTDLRKADEVDAKTVLHEFQRLKPKPLTHLEGVPGELRQEFEEERAADREQGGDAFLYELHVKGQRFYVMYSGYPTYGATSVFSHAGDYLAGFKDGDPG